MTERKIYFGSVGPYLYEDTDDIDDGDGDFPGQKISATVTDGIMKASEFLGVLISSVSVVNIDDPSSELNSLSASTVGGFISVYQSIAGVNDPFTIYLWDTDAAAENIPYTVDGNGGVWIAVGGKYISGELNIEGSINGSYDPTDIICYNNTVICHNDEVVIN